MPQPLNLNVIFTGEIYMAVNQLERAFRAWPVLIDIAKRRTTITYGELGAKLDIHHRAVRYVLGILQDYCLEEG